MLYGPPIPPGRVIRYADLDACGACEPGLWEFYQQCGDAVLLTLDHADMAYRYLDGISRLLHPRRAVALRTEDRECWAARAAARGVERRALPEEDAAELRLRAARRMLEEVIRGAPLA
jgi:hypothetical protein